MPCGIPLCGTQGECALSYKLACRHPRIHPPAGRHTKQHDHRHTRARADSKTASSRYHHLGIQYQYLYNTTSCTIPGKAAPLTTTPSEPPLGAGVQTIWLALYLPSRIDLRNIQVTFNYGRGAKAIHASDLCSMPCHTSCPGTSCNTISSARSSSNPTRCC